MFNRLRAKLYGWLIVLWLNKHFWGKWFPKKPNEQEETDKWDDFLDD